jgi:hypothetical protein
MRHGSSKQRKGRIKQRKGRIERRRRNAMSRNKTKCLFSVLAALALALPLVARGSANKGSKSGARASMELTRDATVGGKQVKAGTYDVKASESTLTLVRNGKVVAEAPIEWKDESPKSAYSSIIVDSGAVKEIHFMGKNRYVQLASGSTEATGQ